MQTKRAGMIGGCRSDVRSLRDVADMGLRGFSYRNQALHRPNALDTNRSSGLAHLRDGRFPRRCFDGGLDNQCRSVQMRARYCV
jgi:hypothetical protein